MPQQNPSRPNSRFPEGHSAPHQIGRRPPGCKPLALARTSFPFRLPISSCSESISRCYCLGNKNRTSIFFAAPFHFDGMAHVNPCIGHHAKYCRLTKRGRSKSDSAGKKFRPLPPIGWENRKSAAHLPSMPGRIRPLHNISARQLRQRKQDRLPVVFSCLITIPIYFGNKRVTRRGAGDGIWKDG